MAAAGGISAGVRRMLDVSRHKRVDTRRASIRRAEEIKEHARAGLP